MGETPQTPAPDRPAPPVPVSVPESEPEPPQASPPHVPNPPLQASPPLVSDPPLLLESAPSTPREEYHTPPPSLDEARDEAVVVPQQGDVVNRALAKSPQLLPVLLHLSPHRLLPPAPGSPAVNGEDGAAGMAPAPGRRPARPQLHVATGRLVRTPSQGSLAMSSPSPLPTSPSPLTPAPATAPTPTPTAKSKSGQTTPKHAEALKPPASPVATATAIAMQSDQAEDAITSHLRIGNGKAARFDHQRAPVTGAAENGIPAGEVPPDVAAVAAVGERRPTSATLRVATAVLSLVSFSLMASARTSGWDGDHYGRYEQYRYAVGVNVVVCIYSIAQAFGEIRRLVSPRFIFRSMSSYYFSLFLDQVLAYLLMSASSAAASRNDLWVSRFGKDPFNKKINSAVWFSFIAFIGLATNSLISTANLFSMV